MVNRDVLKTALILFSFTFLFSCAQKGINFSSSEFQPVDGSNYLSKVDNFLVVLDSSSSMNEKYNGNKKIDIAKQIAGGMNVTLPEMGQTGGLRTLGHSQRISRESTKLFYGMEKYSSAGFAKGLDVISETGGTTPLSKAINAAASDFEGLSGNRNALIVISDGNENLGSSVEQAKALKEKYGASLCVYPVLVGNNPDGEMLMKSLATIGNCGFYTTADQLLNDAGMTGFVEKVFLGEKPAPKVVAPAPKPAPPAAPAPKDSDNDGVTDDKDRCPGTPIGAHVNPFGCWVLDQVLFGHDKDIIRPEAYPFLDDVVAILKKNPDMNVTLQGHTDATGSAKYNLGLSLKRANAVKQYLINNDISASRLDTKGFGEAKPIASNDSKTGRAFNRRVEIRTK